MAQDASGCAAWVCGAVLGGIAQRAREKPAGAFPAGWWWRVVSGQKQFAVYLKADSLLFHLAVDLLADGDNLGAVALDVLRCGVAVDDGHGLTHKAGGLAHPVAAGLGGGGSAKHGGQFRGDFLHLLPVVGGVVGFGGAASSTNAQVLGIEVPMATAISDVAEARRDYLDESGGRYVHVIADGAMGHSGDIVKALACGADAAMLGVPLARATEAPGRGWHWGQEAWHESLPRGRRVRVDQVGALAEVMLGPSHRPDGTMNLVGALRRAMASTGYTEVKAFQRIDLIIH